MADHEADDQDRRLSEFVNGEMSGYRLVPKHQTKAQVFKYFKPEIGKRDRILKKLCLTDIVFAGVQVLRPGAGNVMHSHSGMDGIYFVLKGRIAFYGEGDVVLGELEPLQGIAMPRGTPYWFKAVSEEPVEMLHIEAFDRRVSNKKTTYPKSPDQDVRLTIDTV